MRARVLRSQVELFLSFKLTFTDLKLTVQAVVVIFVAQLLTNVAATLLTAHISGTAKQSCQRGLNKIR